MAVKYNSTKTCFFILPEGAAPTTRGHPYFTRFTDGNRNVMTRAVDRPVVASRYFGKFSKVDVSDQRRQHELGLEMKWVVKGEESGKFRMATTIFGQGVIDTMQTLRGQSHPGHPIRSVTTKDFAESLASEMVDNELDGKVSRPKEKKRKRATPLPKNTDSHVLSKIGTYPGTKTPVQLHCAMCHKKAPTYCTAAGCGRVTICQSGKRSCHIDHSSGVARKRSKK